MELAPEDKINMSLGSWENIEMYSNARNRNKLVGIFYLNLTEMIDDLELMPHELH